MKPSGDSGGGGGAQGLSLDRIVIQRMGEVTAKVTGQKAEATWKVATRPDDPPEAEYEYFFVAKIPSESLSKRSQNLMALEKEAPPPSDAAGEGPSTSQAS